MVIYIVSARLKPEGMVQSCCVILGSITQSKYLYGALKEACLPNLQVCFFLEPPNIPVGLALRKLPSSPTKLDAPLSQLSFGCGKQRYLYLYKGESSGVGFNARCRATSPRPN